MNKQILKTVGILRPKFFQDGDYFCFLFGDNLQDGIAGFGKTPAEAAKDFYENFHKRKPLDPPPKRIH